MHKVLSLKENISVNEERYFRGFLKEVKTVFLTIGVRPVPTLHT